MLEGSSLRGLVIEFIFIPSHELLDGVKILSPQSLDINENMHHLYYM